MHVAKVTAMKRQSTGMWAVEILVTVEESFMKAYVKPTPTEKFPKERLKINEWILYNFWKEVSIEKVKQ